MTKKNYILPMKARNILFLIYPGFELLDLSGPVSVFSTANALQENSPYHLQTVSMSGGLITSGSFVAVNSESVSSVVMTSETTILVVGGDAPAIRDASISFAIRDWLSQNAHQGERLGSICSGTFILAAAGLLKDRSVTTHWAGCDLLAQMYSDICVKPESLYVVDEHVWTSAGVTTGLDMALEMLRRDLGKSVMNRVAKQLVVYAHRPGNQSQFSNLLKLQTSSNSDYAELFAWLDTRLDQPIKVEEMASFMCMSERTFYRRFTSEVGVTPSKYVEEVKLNRAKYLIEDNLQISQVSVAVGFKSEAAFRTRFERYFGLTPSMHKQLHSVK